MLRIALAPLKWIAEEEVVYSEERNELHRPNCIAAAGSPLNAGEALELVWAPRSCERCRPRVLLRLGDD